MMVAIYLFYLTIPLHKENIIFPEDPLPRKSMDVIRQLSDPRLKRRFSYKQYENLRIMLTEVGQIFKENDIVTLKFLN